MGKEEADAECKKKDREEVEKKKRIESKVVQKRH
jgi:hypothetical protein